jgi:YVTN family beta-propeller protein
MISRRALLWGTAAALGCGRPRATAFPGYAFVAIQGNNSIAVVDLTRFSVSRQIPLESTPFLVVADQRRRAIYVLAERPGAIYEVDPAALRIKRKVALPGRAISMQLAPGGGFLFALCQSPNLLVRVPLDKFGIASQIKLPGAPDSFDVSADGLLAAATFPEIQSVGVIELAANSIARVRSSGPDSRAVLFRFDGRELLIANRRERMLTIIDVRTGDKIVRLPLPVEPQHYCVKADGGQIFISGAGMDAIVVVHPYQTEVAEARLAGKAPGAIAISQNPELLFAANPESSAVTVLEVETRDALAAVNVGREPYHIAFTPDNQYALVVNRGSGDLAVIRVPAIKQSRAKSAPLFTMIPVGTRPVSVGVVEA